MDVVHKRIIPPYYCDQGPHSGMEAVPFMVTVYMTQEEFAASGGEVDIILKVKDDAEDNIGVVTNRAIQDKSV